VSELAASATVCNVPAEEFAAMDAALAAKRAERIYDTFREDYEVGVIGGEFHVDYLGRCAVCGFEHRFRHNGPVWPGSGR
jgi:hypothetical protein